VQVPIQFPPGQRESAEPLERAAAS
jgi:hypothetical protein